MKRKRFFNFGIEILKEFEHNKEANNNNFYNNLGLNLETIYDCVIINIERFYDQESNIYKHKRKGANFIYINNWLFETKAGT